MFNNFKDMQSLFSGPFASPFEAFTKPTREAATKLGAISAETTDYTKKSFERGRDHFERLAGVATVEDAVQLQSDFAKSAYGDYVAQSTKIAEMYSDLVRAAFPQTDNKSAKRAPTKGPGRSFQN